MKNITKRIFCAIVICLLGVIGGFAAGALPSSIIVTPSSPTPLSTITVSITVSGEAPSEVRVAIEECNGDIGICYPDAQNVSMSLVSSGTYETDVTLKHADATYITCEVFVKEDGTWSSYEKKNVTLSENSNGDNGNGGNDSPGFEVILFVAAVCAGLILVGRKRVK